MPPITASTQSRAKLKAFAFDDANGRSAAREDGHGEEDDGKENARPADDFIEDLAFANPMNPPPCPSSQKSTTKDARECPQTPVGRLPLSQLLANGDELSQYLNATPVERVLWENSPAGSETSNSAQPSRKRKRAYSSSPSSSAQAQPGKKISIVDVKAMQDALKTPKANLIDDLWSRYSLHTGDKRSLASDDLRLPHTFHSSSPQTPAPNPLCRDSGGLRRAFSCIDWPTSAAKRRKLALNLNGQTELSKPADFEKPVQSIEHNKMSRVNFLVEKIHEDLARPINLRDVSSEASRSSPILPMLIKTTDGIAEGQVDQVVVNQVARTLSQNAVHGPNREFRSEGSDRRADSPTNQPDATSEYGDDDLDFGIMEALAGATSERAGTATPEQPSNTKASKAESVKMEACTDGALLIEPTTTRTGNEDPIIVQNEEGFGDDEDEEMTAAELADVFAQYDVQPVPATNSKVSGQGHKEAARKGCVEEEDQAVKNVGSNRPRELPSRKVTASVHVVSDDEEDDFGADSDFENIALEYDARGGFKPGKDGGDQNTDRPLAALNRCVIKNIVTEDHEITLFVEEESSKLRRSIVLRQAWVESVCTVGMHIHVVGQYDKYGQYVVDDAQNYVILYPDYLISSTVVGDSFTCMRKAVLEDRVKATSDANQSTIYGHILHEIFQEAMRANRWDDQWMSSTVSKIVTRHMEELFEINIELAMAIDQIQSRTVELQAWAKIFIAATPQPEAVVKDRNGAQSLMCVNKLLEVEEKVWSPRFGLKGNVDATVQILLDDQKGKKTLTVPFELKTGKYSNAAHKAQTALYTLLLSDRYGEYKDQLQDLDIRIKAYLDLDIDIACGILYYMQSSEISSIRAMRHEIVPMVMQRNRLAGFIRHRQELPKMLKNPYTCGRCYAKTTCFIYHKLVDGGTGETSGVGEKFDDIVKHLRPAHQEFFFKWDSLLTKEEKDVVKLRRELWTMSGVEREKAGRCFSNVMIEPGSLREGTSGPKINRFTYSFVKRSSSQNFSFLESQITVGEPIVISDEKGHFALASGYVSRIRKHKLQVMIDRRLDNTRRRESNFDPLNNQAFVGVMRVVGEGISLPTTSSPSEEPLVYRLDKDEFSNGMALIRNNLVKLMDKETFGAQALRRLLVEGVPPTFLSLPDDKSLSESSSHADLNVDQKAAIGKVMSAKDYALVLGMPGTGKTTTIAHIIRSLVAQGKNVLLTSYTHTAVDNILLKLRKDNIGIFRVGAIAKVHPEIQEFADLAGRPMQTIEDLKRCYTRQVVATTCLGINHPIFNQRIFDYCIVDEASQITLPVCLGPIRMAKTFILVGDHYQLPPLVQNKEALDGGLDISLFKMLSDAHPESVVNLEHQYRMCEDIMALSNTLIYKGRLKCGNPSVASRSVTIPNISALKKHHHTPATVLSGSAKHICSGPTRGTCWLRDLLDPSVKACFVNTDPLNTTAREVLENGSRITSPCEVALTAQLVESLLTTGISPTDIGVITFYRSQLALIKQSLRHRPGIEMHTADRFQGRDKEVVVLSLVRSNDMQIVGDLLKDWRRVNVALTRARTKLLILGSKSTLFGNDLLKDMILLMENKGWSFNLPVGALEGHIFEDGCTQFSSGKAASGGIITIEDDNEMRDARTAKTRTNSVAITAAAAAATITGKESTNNVLGGQKQPLKQARLDVKGLIGKRPILRDIVNDAY